MLIDHFPLLGLRLQTPRLELRLPVPDDLGALADAAFDGIHAPDVMPFTYPWTDAPPAEVARGVVLHHWRTLGAWTPQQWALDLSVFHEGTVVGQQSVSANHLAVTREVSTGSWLGRRFHGKGIGTEMRAAVLHLAFVGLGAEHAVSAAADDNPASQAVSRKLGYEPDGVERHVVGTTLSVHLRLRLTRAAWEAHRTVPVTFDGLPACLPLFGR